MEVDLQLYPEVPASYDAEYLARAEAGEPNAIDRANAIVASGLIALGRVTGNREDAEARLIADAYNAFREVRACASLAARFHQEEREAAAERCIARAEKRAADIRALAPDKFADDAGLVPVFADGRKGAVKGKRR